LLLKLTECKENSEQECKKYEDQLTMLKIEKQQVEAEFQQFCSTQKSTEDGDWNSLVIEINKYTTNSLALKKSAALC